MAQQAKLFLLEDEEHLAFTLEFNLVQEGYLVDVCTTLHEARARLDRHRYDVLILDVMLPDGSGFDLCSEIRTEGDFTPVIFLTARGRSEDIIRGLEVGADHYITKPFSLDELFARIAALLRRLSWQEGGPSEGPSEGHDVFDFGPHRVDFTTHQVTARGVEVELTALEMKLLRYFLERPDKVIPRTELLEEVWNVSPEANTRAVDNFIVRLRKLFEDDPAEPRWFQTVRGVGYRFAGADSGDA
ncbi:MAG: response regulator transcription factor [Myxococcales bacterium]|nr:response regulator transcription factor [Myxococcales bacterium]